MKSTKLIRVIEKLIDNEVVRFEDETQTTFVEIYRASQYFFHFITKAKSGVLLCEGYFNNYEDDGGAVRLCWDEHIVGLILADNIDLIAESIYS